MICPTCGGYLPDNAKFCGVCGAPIVQQSPAFQQATTLQPSVPADYFMTDPMNASKQAMTDIKSSPGWIKRIFLLAVMNMIPILSFYSIGYSLQWATTAWRNIPRDLPRGVFNKDSFLMGLFFALLSYLLPICTSWLVICNIIPIAGTILWLVLLVQAWVFFLLAAVRMTAFNRLGAAFDMSDIFVKLRIKSSGLYKAVLVPWAICIGIIFAMFLVAFIVCTLIGMMLAGGTLALGGNFLMVIMVAFTRVIWLYAIFMLAILVASLFLTQLAVVWSLRALGYWYGYHAFDWICQAEDEKRKK